MSRQNKGLISQEIVIESKCFIGKKPFLLKTSSLGPAPKWELRRPDNHIDSGACDCYIFIVNQAKGNC